MYVCMSVYIYIYIYIYIRVWSLHAGSSILLKIIQIIGLYPSIAKKKLLLRAAIRRNSLLRAAIRRHSLLRAAMTTTTP